MVEYHLEFWLLDHDDQAVNPNLDFVLVDAAQTLTRLRSEGKRVFLYCAAGEQRTPSVAIAYAATLGVDQCIAAQALRKAMPMLGEGRLWDVAERDTE